MKEKLTLSINKRTIERSKKLAKMKGVSLSKMVEDYLNNSVEANSSLDRNNITIVDELLGCITLDDTKEYKTLIEEARVERKKTNESSD